MHATFHPASTGPDTTAPAPTRLSHALAAGVVVAGAGLLAAAPTMSTMSDIQHRAVGLMADTDVTDTGITWSDVMSTAQQNIAELQDEMAAAPNPLLTQISSNFADYTQLITGMQDVVIGLHGDGSLKTIDSGFLGIQEGIDALINGTSKTPGFEELLQDMSTFIQNGDPLSAFNELNLYTLHGMEDIFKPLVPVVTIPERMLENFTNLLNQTVGPENLWGLGKDITKAFSSPLIGFGYELSTILNQSGDGDSSVGDPLAALVNALINGYQAPGADGAFAGLLNSGGLLEGLLVSWPQQFADALTVGTADLPVNADDSATGTAEAVASLDTGSFTDAINDLFANL